MRRRPLLETIEVQVILQDVNLNVTVQNMVSLYGQWPYPELSVLLVQLRWLACVHQTHHWQARGDSFYGDHLLFERLYNSVVGEIDAIAEKAVGLGTTSNVDLITQVGQLNDLSRSYGPTMTIPNGSELMYKSYVCELQFLKVTSILVELMKEKGCLTRGLDNLIAGIEDVHENNVYLLKQRLTPDGGRLGL